VFKDEQILSLCPVFCQATLFVKYLSERIDTVKIVHSPSILAKHHLRDA